MCELLERQIAFLLSKIPLNIVSARKLLHNLYTVVYVDIRGRYSLGLTLSFRTTKYRLLDEESAPVWAEFGVFFSSRKRIYYMPWLFQVRRFETM